MIEGTNRKAGKYHQVNENQSCPDVNKQIENPTTNCKHLTRSNQNNRTTRKFLEILTK